MFASALREMFGVQLYKNNACALLSSKFLIILNLDWLQYGRCVRRMYEFGIMKISDKQGFRLYCPISGFFLFGFFVNNTPVLFWIRIRNTRMTGGYLKGHWTSITSSPGLFPKKVGIFIPLEVLALVMTACWFLPSWFNLLLKKYGYS